MEIKLTLSDGKKEIELTTEQIDELYALLGRLKNKDKEYIPYPIYPIIPVINPYPFEPVTTYVYGTATSADSKGIKSYLEQNN